MSLPHDFSSRPLQETFDNLVKRIKGALDRLGVLEALGLTKRRRGVANVTTVAAATGSTTVTHGLGVTPTLVLVSSQNTSGAGLVTAGVSSAGPTTFDIQTRYGDGVARSLTIIVGWEAIA